MTPGNREHDNDILNDALYIREGREENPFQHLDYAYNSDRQHLFQRTGLHSPNEGSFEHPN